MAAIIQHVNMIPEIYTASEFKKQLFMELDVNYLDQRMRGQNSTLYRGISAHDPKVTTPKIDPHYTLRQQYDHKADGMMSSMKVFPLSIPCGKNTPLKQSISAYEVNSRNQMGPL